MVSLRVMHRTRRDGFTPGFRAVLDVLGWEAQVGRLVLYFRCTAVCSDEWGGFFFGYAVFQGWR